MKTALFFAIRYLFSKKSVNAINVISGISVVGVLVSSASLIAILSFYNGLEKFILSMYSSFAPELKIEPAVGKTFDPDTAAYFSQLKVHPSVVSYNEVLEEKVLLRYGDGQFIAHMKGVGEGFFDQWQTDTLLYYGDTDLWQHDGQWAVVGIQVDQALRIAVRDESRTIEVFSPRKGVTQTMNPAEEFIMRTVRPKGIIGGDPEIDDLVVVPMAFAREMVGEYEQVSSVELHTNLKSSDKFQKELQQQLGDDYVVKNREEQNPTLYKIIMTEKWVIFAIIAFTGMIAIFNIIGSLTMLVMDKRKDIAVLKALGAPNRLIQRIFFWEGMMISIIGCVAGLVIGLLICLSQQYFGWLKFEDAENLYVEVYPVDIRYLDFLLVFATVVLVSALISYVSSRLSVRQTERLA